MAENKRKGGPGGTGDGPHTKKSKGGSSGKWKTPHQESKLAAKMEKGTALSIGDQGIWVTYARNMKSKAMREFKELCEEYGEIMYGIKRPSETELCQDKEEEGLDIEASIQQELDSMKAETPKTRQTFSIVHSDVECLFFVKTMKPVEPVEFVRKICQDARDCQDVMRRKTKYINRLTPVLDMEKASERGIEKVARAVMTPYFNLNSEDVDGKSAEQGTAEKPQGEESKPNFTYAIRYSIRNHSTFKSDAVIKKVASLVRPEHKVDLTKPDKVVLVEIYQVFCGVSVVDAVEWESLKRYNVNELYRLASEKNKGDVNPGGGTISA